MTIYLQCGEARLALARPLVMGIVNVTPDSFSDGGYHASASTAIAHARRLIDEGADLIDIGGESTRPGSQGVSLDEERRRVLPVLEALAGKAVPISVDTQKPELMREALAAGAAMINDVNALLAPGAIAAVAAGDAAVCIMHKQGDTRDMQRNPHYADVVAEVEAFLDQRVRALQAAGIARERIVVDPGLGFGKSLEHNLALLRRLERFSSMGYAVMVGASRKSMLGSITGRAVDERVYASIAAALIAAEKGAHILRVHDVAATCDALAVWQAVRGTEQA